MIVKNTLLHEFLFYAKILMKKQRKVKNGGEMKINNYSKKQK